VQARVADFRPSPDAPRLHLGDTVRVTDGVKDYGGREGTIEHFSSDSKLSIGLHIPGGEFGHMAYFAPDEVELVTLATADTVVLDAVEDLPLMGGAW
jgi:hypothetical protein